MQGRRQIFLLLAIMMLIAIGVGGIALFTLYRASFQEQHEDLVELARHQVELINAVARFNIKYSPDVPGGPPAATLQEMRDAHFSVGGIGKTGEYILAKQDGDQIVFLLPHRHVEFPYPDSVPLSSKPAEPRRRALAGESGIMVYRGFRGTMVLGAYEPVKELQWALLVKMDVEEIRAPFVRAGVMATASGLVFILLGTVLFFKVGNPLVQRLEESERKYRSMFESAADRMLLIAPSGVILDANPAACSAYEYTRDELVGRDVQDIVHPEHRSFVEESYKIVATGKMFRRESIHLRKDGSMLPAEVQLSPIIHEGHAAILVSARDITARKEAEQALRESEVRYRTLSESLEKTVERKVAELQQAETLAALGRIVSVVAHEIRNPLQNIHMGVDSLKSSIQINKETQEILEGIDYGVELLRNIVEELLNYSRPVRLQYSKSSAGELVRRAINMVAAELQNINVSLELNQENRPMSVDVPKMIRVLINILSNAIEAMPGGGDIRIRSDFSEKEGIDLLRFSISDSGAGIGENTLKHMFEPFYTTKARGTGLGLAICRKIMSAHQGDIIITSKVREGTTVDLILPVRMP